MPANDKSDWQIEKDKQKITTTKRGHCCSRLASGKVRFLGHKSIQMPVSYPSIKRPSRRMHITRYISSIFEIFCHLVKAIFF